MFRKTIGALTAVTFGWLVGCSSTAPESTVTQTQELVTDAGVCVQNVLCIRGDHFDNVLCRCVPDVDAGVCVQNVLCIQGDHFDDVLCRCVPDVDAGACISGEDGPCGGFTQSPCRCGPGLVCVPNRIPDIPGTCKSERCRR